MRKILYCVILLSSLFYNAYGQAAPEQVIEGKTINAFELTGADHLVQNIPIPGTDLPEITLTDVQTKTIEQLPAGARAGNTFLPDVFLATARKQHYASVRIPLYKKENGEIKQLSSYKITLRETAPAGSGRQAERPTGTAAATSVLASGIWYKIAVSQRGIFKIDYAFLQSIGINPATVNPQNIRIYGNGGTVLPEAVDSNQPDDLIENAILVHASGNTFTTNDYVLFYANGPVLWQPALSQDKFIHTNNYYEDHSYYFLNFDKGPGKRVSTENATGTAGNIYTQFNDYKVIDVDSYNLGSIGKEWWSNRMNSINPASLTSSLSLDLGAVTGPVTLDAEVCNVNDASGNTLKLNINNENLYNFNLDANGDGFLLRATAPNLTFTPSSPNLDIKLQYLPNGNGSAYLGYLQFNYMRPLRFSSGFLAFRNLESAGLAPGSMAEYQIGNAPPNLTVWDITDPLNPVALNGQLSGNTFSFTREGGTLKEFVAFSGSQFPTPSFVGNVPNQNLHGLGETDFLIITNKTLLPAAEELADFHWQHDQLKVTVATVDQIYNEFSSGGQDIGGIRNFIKMFYERANNPSDMLQNVLLFGAASYDYKDRVEHNTNIVPTFETMESGNGTNSYASDDYFAFLDNGESINNYAAAPLLDIGIGRIPSYNLEESQKAVAKIEHYASPASFGPWKNIVTYVADDKDEDGSMNHLNDCESANVFFRATDHLYNLYKIYSDAYPKVSSSGEARYPAVNRAINNQVFNGTFLMSYSGHGSPTRWSHKAILTPDDYGHWTNKDKLPLMITATCDFGRFDDPDNRSAGAKLMLNPDGGSIAMVTTTQAVYAGPNTALVKNFVKKQFTANANGEYPSIGKALTAAKNESSDSNNNKFVVLGDPALKLQMPVYPVATDSLLMEGEAGYIPTDTIKALGKYILKGSVKDHNGNVLTGFNGTIYATIYDKKKTVQTINTTPGTTPTFQLQTNIVAKIRADVQNGHFSAHFLVPKDINYDFGSGKISYYANTDQTDAAGMDSSFTVGGHSDNYAPDADAPIVKPYIDNDKFRDGGVTGPNPLLFVKLYDKSGINVSGNSLGHDLVAILDGNIQNPIVMNDYYQTEENDYTNGYVKFPLYNLPDGEHTILVKAWDAYNNSGEGTVTFVVNNQDKGFISDLYNYPNPVTDITHFVFQHNQKGVEMSVSLRIFNTAGGLVKNMQYEMKPEGNRTEITWDGKGDGGSLLSKGVYFYRLQITTEKGVTATAYQKLVLLR